jgi:hypothetical protein
MPQRLGDLIARSVFAIKHHVGLKDTAAAFARRYGKRCEVQPIEISVAVRQRCGVQPIPCRVEANQLVLKVGAADHVRASHAADKVKAPVKVDDLPAPGGLVQTVNILGEEQLAPAAFFQPRQRVMRVVGFGLSEPSPADHASRPGPEVSMPDGI